jgi:predicted glycoside hydrolase/deacetylase ChbG (UPF0249 family)
MTSAKRVIVNADDLGRTAGINRGVFEAHGRGIVTSASLMVNLPAAAEAAALAKENPELGVGLHLTLTHGAPVSRPEQVPSLVDAQGRFHRRPEGLDGVPPVELLDEARAQLRRFRQLLGRDPTHFDTHHDAHYRPAVLETMLTLAWETGLPVRRGSAPMAEQLRREGIPTTDAQVRDFHGEGATLEALLGILFAATVGTTEIVCHPGFVDEDLRASSSYVDDRRRELDVLTQREVRQAIQAVGIKLIHFGQL